MAKAILLCGKICSGKSRYAAELVKRTGAVAFSCDELMLSLGLDQALSHLEDAHRAMTPKIKRYLCQKAVEVVAAGADVLLDFGGWSRAERAELSAYFSAHGTAHEWHYIHVTDEDWARNIAERNRSIREDGLQAYFIDAALMQKARLAFEPPTREEIDVWIENVR